ncbi:MAG: histidine--tRNA ligase, partial [Sutterella sp.]|nr:histidine--tRNA ligase [Sutterella sp.]
THPGEASIKSQMKKADASGAKLAVFATADELAQGMVGIKALRAGANAYAEQALEPVNEAAARVAAALKA